MERLHNKDCEKIQICFSMKVKLTFFPSRQHWNVLLLLNRNRNCTIWSKCLFCLFVFFVFSPYWYLLLHCFWGKKYLFYWLHLFVNTKIFFSFYLVQNIFSWNLSSSKWYLPFKLMKILPGKFFILGDWVCYTTFI